MTVTIKDMGRGQKITASRSMLNTIACMAAWAEELQISKGNNAIAEEMKNIAHTIGIVLAGYLSSWYVIDTACYDGQQLFLLESEQYGDESPCLIVNRFGDVLLDDVWNGFDDWEEYIL